MVEHQIKRRRIQDQCVLDAFYQIPREKFVLHEFQSLAFSDGPLSIGHGQTISQPYVVAFMTEATKIKPGDHCLEVGTGSGYQTAILSKLCAEVYTLEIVEDLYRGASYKILRES